MTTGSTPASRASHVDEGQVVTDTKNWQDEFDPWLAEQMRKPEFRRAFRRASRAAANDHHEAVAVKPSRRTRGWRHGR